MDNVILFPCADVCVMFSLCLLHSCFWAAVDLLSSLWEQLTSTTTSRGIPAPCTLDLCTPCALLVPFVASFLEPICFHIMWIPFLTTSLHLISVINYFHLPIPWMQQFVSLRLLYFYRLDRSTLGRDVVGRIPNLWRFPGSDCHSILLFPQRTQERKGQSVS